MQISQSLTLAYSEILPGPGQLRVRVRAGRVFVSALLLATTLASLLVACASLPATLPPAPHGRFTDAVADGVIYSTFGDVRQRAGGRIGYHGGIDLAAPRGTPVHAAGEGQVVFAGWGYHGSPDWGLLVAIDHGDGWLSLYAHLSEADVEAGDSVRGGAPIGRIGSTGNATGPHVHIEVRHEGTPVDPAGQIPGLG